MLLQMMTHHLLIGNPHLIFSLLVQPTGLLSIVKFSYKSIPLSKKLSKVVKSYFQGFQENNRKFKIPKSQALKN